MMADPVVSSPLGDRKHYDIFQQPSSPKQQHDDLPAEFGDQSFGSSMSLGSSFELNRLAASPSASSMLCVQSVPPHCTLQSAPPISLQKSPPRTFPESLGAAMGTILNSRTPGLAAKMSSPFSMDMSPTSIHITPTALGNGTPSKGKPPGSNLVTSHSEEQLPPGSAMKEDPPEAQQTHSTVSGGSLGRLFGTELSLNGPSRKSSVDCVFGQACSMNDDGLLESPEKEPPAKRRPSSLPISQATSHIRPSLRAAGMGPPSIPVSQNRRPSLLKSMTTTSSTDTVAKDKMSTLEALRQQHRVSDSAIPTNNSLAFAKTHRSRSGSMEHTDAIERPTRTSLPPPSHPTIVESPSPSKLNDNNFAGYFFDPQSPDLTKDIQRGLRPPRVSQPSARPRVLEKAASSAALPSMSSTLLGKRSNPYSKHPSLATSVANLNVSQQPTLPRMRVPAPRRCQSAIDNSAAFAMGEDMSMSSAEGDCTNDTSPTISIRANGPPQRFPPGFDANGSPIASGSRCKSRPNLFRRPSKDDSSPLGYGKRFAVKEGMESSPRPGQGSVENMPGFGASEREGKILPCFNVKDDGLMRIKADTLLQVLQGQYDHLIDTYEIVDCRFGYEYTGGHIQGAINLSTMEKVKRYFLDPKTATNLPLRCQSGKPDKSGNLKRKILIFHCEFSMKRGPSSALALRQADRALAHDYPNCHYPELYVLEGGYAGFFAKHSQVCEPQRYVRMDDPQFQDCRSKELNGFRKQFSRHRSFTYGDTNNSASRATQSDGAYLAHASKHNAVKTIREEDSSFENSASPTAIQADALLARRKGFQRHATAGPLPVQSDSQYTLATAHRPVSSSLGIKPVLGKQRSGNLAEDLSFGSSIAADSSSSFEASVSESPCAAAHNRTRPSVPRQPHRSHLAPPK